MNSIYSTRFTRPKISKILNLHISATKQDRDMQFSGMESVIGGEYIWMENSQNENQHQITKIKQMSLL